MSTFRPGDPTEIKSQAQLVEFFAPGGRKRGRLGMELELLPLDARARLVPYAGLHGVESALKNVGGKRKRILEGEHVIAINLAKGGMVSLEPGGQVEVDSPPAEKLADLAAFFGTTLSLLSKSAQGEGFGLFPWGVAPYGSPEDLADVPKARYRLLREHLLASGSLGRWMMKLTAAGHFCLDYENEGDMRRKVAALLPLLPYAVAFTANAPVALGRRSRWLTRRPWIWRHTDPLRCGLPALLFSPKLSFGAYVRYAMARPLLFLVRDGRYVPGGGRTFEDWLKRPGHVGPLTVGDWDLHLSTLFPDLRLRAGYLEIRTLDALPLPLFLAMGAFFKGLLAEPGILHRVSRQAPELSPAGVRRSLLDAARRGPAWAPLGAPQPRNLMLRLLALAATGLGELGEGPRWLGPLDALVRRAVCPAHFWRRDEEGIWRGPGLFGGSE